MKNLNNQTDSYDSLSSSLRYVFIKRNFLLLAVVTWGFMLGGSLLVLLTTAAVALLHGNVYIAVILVTLEAALLLSEFWHLGYWVCRSFKVTAWNIFPSLFLLTSIFSFLLPCFFVLSLISSQRSNAPKEVQQREAPPLFSKMFTRLVHIN